MAVAQPTQEFVVLQDFCRGRPVFELHALADAGEQLPGKAVSAGDPQQILDVVVIDFLGLGLVGGERADERHRVEADQPDGKSIGDEVVVEREGPAFGDVGQHFRRAVAGLVEGAIVA